ncbi:cytochrome p450 [Diplodia corticola]|uniref:Cytochrome p450 n=1 Tax=Diplodia corticola TaxID=236234 RepID=A0A1J9S8J2_9PEZI|nr:cytochrome p450 [Diplodia corticola]OJD35901.1 cytochrome p450 [Diplodia corticola]
MSIAALILLHAVSTAVYNIYFHPLSAYPGPISAACTNLTYWSANVTGDLLPWIQSVHRQYGEVVRLGPNTLSYTNPDAWKDIYGHPRSNKRSGGGGGGTNSKDMLHYPAGLNGRHALNALHSDAEHARVRRLFSPAFSEKALKDQEPLLATYASRLVAHIRNNTNTDTGTPLDLAKLLTCTTMDIMSTLSFGSPLGLLPPVPVPRSDGTDHDRDRGTASAEYTPWVAAIFASTKAADLSRLTLEYPLLGLLAARLTPRRLRDEQRLHFQAAADRVDRRVERGAGEADDGRAEGHGHGQVDMWSYVLDGRGRGREGSSGGGGGDGHEPGPGLDREDMYVNASVFMLAGSETTATALSGLVWFLCRDAAAMGRACGEVRAAFPGGKEGEAEMTLASVRELAYLGACVKEALRLYPPLPIGPPRAVHPDGNVVCGRWVPGKTRVAVAQYTAYRSPLYFKDAEKFVPERWLPGTGYEGDRRDVMQAFSYGPRNCIGKSLAYHEMRLILAKLLWNFDFELCPESDGWINQKCYTLWQKDPLWVKARPIR